MSPALQHSLNSALTAIVIALLGYFLGTAPAQEQAAYAESRWVHWKKLNTEKRQTLDELRNQVKEAEDYCGCPAGFPEGPPFEDVPE